ncbi:MULTISPECIES: hydrolase 2, exosortase A system-associated [unclassified Janthinobacterium]|uniref:hydrolase 2, exosortase A system-associated n=1 Tax=unclassified Janthinobacterium TaxID=2610881 RepID=UPI000346ED7C|nr:MULTISPECIES: hydrolase 2, exosortase A system-associated [unclassified Janthinobacterium]MEC5161281.1 exosortase A-associated hydrolase 2 [Janthinobacterium sp. CG_S6]
MIGLPAVPFFLPASPGERYCLFYQPAPEQTPRGAILYVHPFGEELNKSRRMAAQQARAFAALGYSVLQIDLYGCGDSSGDFASARWHIWKRDLVLACEWLTRRVAGPLSLWGLRLGALLALDLANRAPRPLERVILWHPVFKGKTHLDQFLRMRVASRMLAANVDARNDTDADADAGAPSARQELAAGIAVEVGGYLLAPELAAAIDALDGGGQPPHCALLWLEMMANDGAVGPAAARQAASWRSAGAALTLLPVRGQAFWSSTEIVECQPLLATTTTALA